MRFNFGAKHINGGDRVTIEAPSYTRAVRRFRVEEAFPHRLSEGRIRTQILGERGYTEDVYLSSKEGSVIPVSHWDERKKEWIDDPPIPVEDPSGESLLALSDRLNASATSLLATASSVTEAPETALSISRTGSNVEVSAKILDLQKRMGELEMMRRELASQVEAARAELARRGKQLWLVELFLGSQETVLQIQEGATAPADDPIVVKQGVLCMDEEMGVFQLFEDLEHVGLISCENIEAFDAWLTSDPRHLEAVCPWSRALVGFRVRRHAQDRDGLDPFTKVAMEERDLYTYLLIRNGQNLYRVWIDVNLWPRLFPSEADVLAASQASWKSDREIAKRRIEHCAAGLIALQGLIERTPIFEPTPERLNVFDPNCQMRRFRLLRDDEDQKLLTDRTDELGHTTWRGYRKWLQSQLEPGMRALVIDLPQYKDLKERVPWSARSNVSSFPSTVEPYTLEDEISTYYGKRFEILYFKNHYDQRRTRYGVYREELLPVDLVSWRVLEHLIRDRGQRQSYCDFIPGMRWYNLTKRQAQHERPFVDLVLKEASMDPSDETVRARCERLVRWWKQKTKEHRILETDEPKALRMVKRALLAGQDFDDDPEKAFLESLQK